MRQPTYVQQWSPGHDWLRDRRLAQAWDIGKSKVACPLVALKGYMLGDLRKSKTQDTMLRKNTGDQIVHTL